MFWLFFPVLIIAGLSYGMWHVWCVLPLCKWLKWIIVILLSLSFLIPFLLFGGGLEKMSLNTASLFYNVGTSSIFILLYLVIIFLVLDVGRLVRLVPRAVLHENGVTTLSIIVLMLVLFIGGNIHYRHKVRVPLELTTNKKLGKDYKVVMASDLHLGYHNRRTELARWVDLINDEHPDLVFFAGDIIDISVRPLLEEGMAEEFRRIEAPVYACLGNHEFYSSQPKAKAFYADAGIHLLIDSVAVVDSVLSIVGRDDRTNLNRKSLSSLMSSVADSTYVVVLNHQPYHLDEAEQCGVDFQFSGHTHRGQVWPISWITDALYECSFGPWQRGDTRYYVSSGLGLWGGKFRIGTQSEYIVATIKGV